MAGAFRLSTLGGLAVDGRDTSSPGSATTATMVPTSTVVPSGTMMWATIPPTGVSSSDSIFAVSTSTSGWPASTESPSATSHLTSSPSSMFMPHWGSSTFVAIRVLLGRFSYLAPAVVWPQNLRHRRVNGVRYLLFVGEHQLLQRRAEWEVAVEACHALYRRL